MGNRASIFFASEPNMHVYLHWNGGAESVYPFLAEMNRRAKGKDDRSPVLRFACVVADMFNEQDDWDGLSLYIEPTPEHKNELALCESINPGDNGVFLIGKDGSVRRFTRSGFMTAEQVEAEKETALKHEYNSKFASAYEALSKFRKSRNKSKQKAVA